MQKNFIHRAQVTFHISMVKSKKNCLMHSFLRGEEERKSFVIIKIIVLHKIVNCSCQIKLERRPNQTNATKRDDERKIKT